MTTFLTIVSGFTIFILGQIFLKMVIDPVAELKRTIANIRFNMIKSAYITHNSDVTSKEILLATHHELRALSAELHSRVSLIPLYRFWRFIFFLPERSKVYAAATNLIAISNWLFHPNEKQLGYILLNTQNLHTNLNLHLPEDSKFSEDLLKSLIT